MDFGDILGGAATLFSPVIGGAAWAGSKKDQTTQNTTSGVRLGPESLQQLQAGQMTRDSMSTLSDYVGRGPNGTDVSNAYGAQKDLASLLAQYQQSGGLPSQSDISTGNSYAKQLFAAQQTGLNQSFTDQTLAANRQAAAMGRDINDPVLRGQMMQEQTRQQNMLNSQQGAYGAQMALNLPGQRLGYAMSRADIMAQLGNQATQNQYSLYGMGQQTLQNERNWNYMTSDKFGNSTMESGGGLKGAITGGIAGIGAVTQMAGSMAGMGGGGGFGAAPKSFSSPMGAPNVGPQPFNGSPMGQPNMGPQQPTWAGPMGPNAGPQNPFATQTQFGK